MAMRPALSLVMSLVIYLACTSIAAAQERETVGSRVDDATITARVKAALIDNEVVKARQIEVETRNGVVQLSGFVDSDDMQEAALRTARAVSGVKEVRNDLALRGGKRSEGKVVDDSIIAAKVKAKLVDDGGLQASNGVNVEVNNGVVQLSGFVTTLEEKNRAADMAISVDGVKDVRNNIALAR
jgi:hyperosmotically inducible periplasmic protein